MNCRIGSIHGVRYLSLFFQTQHMCLFKVYIDRNGKREFLVSNVAIIILEGNSMKFFNQFFEKVCEVSNVEIVKVDTLNGEVILREK